MQIGRREGPMTAHMTDRWRRSAAQQAHLAHSALSVRFSHSCMATIFNRTSSITRCLFQPPLHARKLLLRTPAWRLLARLLASWHHGPLLGNSCWPSWRLHHVGCATRCMQRRWASGWGLPRPWTLAGILCRLLLAVGGRWLLLLLG